MPIDPSIAMGVRAPQFDSPVNALGQLLQVQAAQQQNQLSQAKLGEYQRGVEKTNRLQSLLGSFKPDAPADEQVGALTRGGFLTEARSLAESSAKVATEKRAADKAQLEAISQKLALGAQILGSVKDQASYDAARQTAQQAGLDVANMPAQYDAAFVAAKRTEGLTALQQVEQHWKQQNYDLDLRKVGEDARHNRATEGNAAGQLAVSQGQLGVAQGNLKVSQTREAREATAPKGVVVQSDNGPLMVDPRTGTGTPVTVGGKAIPPKGAGQAVKDAQSVIGLLDLAEPLLDTATHSMVGAGLDRAAAAFGKSTDGAQAAAQLKALEGALVAKQPKMSGPQSDKDVLLYRQMAGQIGDASIPIETRRAAIKTVRALNEKYASQAGGAATPAAAGVPADIAALLQKHGGQ